MSNYKLFKKKKQEVGMMIISNSLPPMLLPQASSVIPNIPSDKSITIPNT